MPGESAPEKLVHTLGIPWPDADEHKLRRAAEAWRTLAGAVEEAHAQTSKMTSTLVSTNDGPAIREFETFWQPYGEKGKGLLPLGTEACNAMAKACDDYANKVEALKHKIEEAAAEVGAALVVGTIGAVFTFGVSEGIADGAAAALSSTILGDIGILTTDAATIVANLGTWAFFGAFNTALTQGALNSVRTAFGDKPTPATQELLSILEGAGGGALLGGAGKGVAAGAERLSEVLSNAGIEMASTDPQTSAALFQIAQSLKSGPLTKAGTSMTLSALNQLLWTQGVSSQALASSGLNAALTKAVENTMDGK